MNRFYSLFVIALISIMLSACAGITQPQDSISRFDQSIHEASTAEVAFLNAVLTTDCEEQFYNSAYKFSISTDPKTNFDLLGYCVPRVITLDQIDIRDTLMKAIVLYADKMQALTSNDQDKQLDTNSQTVAQNLNKLASNGGFKLKDPAIVQGVEAAVIAIANMALDETKYKDLRTAAEKMHPNLVVIVNALKNENFGFGQAITVSLGHIEIMLRTEISLSHQTGKSAASDTFFNIIKSRSILMRADLVTKQSITSPANSTELKPIDAAKPLNDALDAIVSGNQAIANARTGGVYAAANDLYKRAAAAKDIYSSIAKAN
jgi:hypothetical protein